MQILGISGSLREASSNSRLLQAATRLMPAGAVMQITSRPGSLPLFNPDIQPDDVEAVAGWVREMKAADAIVVSTPEYARGYPGALKNALDWLVATDAYVDKPFMLLNASARSTVAQDTLTTVLETMSGIHVAEASTTIPLLGTSLDVPQILDHEAFSGLIRDAMSTFVAEVGRHTRDSGGEPVKG